MNFQVQMADPQVREFDISGFKILVDSDILAPNIAKALENGSYESGERRVLPNVLRAGDRVLEVGTALGCVSMLAARLVGSSNVISFEANPRMVQQARRNFEHNATPILIRNAILKNRVMWAGEGTTDKFYVHKEFWASSAKKTAGSSDELAVPTLCFENEIQMTRANVIVCDIEGGEIDLFRQANLVGIERIIMEIHYWAGRSEINSVIRKLVFDGFSIDFENSFGSIVSMHRGLDLVRH